MGRFGGGAFACVHVGAMWGEVRAPSLDPAATPVSATDNPLTAPGWRRERSGAGPPLAGTRTRVHCQKGVQTRIVSGYRDEIALSEGHRGWAWGSCRAGACLPARRASPQSDAGASTEFSQPGRK